MDMPQDPRMAKAAKREKDRIEILAILKGFSDESSDGGKNITKAEMDEGYSQLIARGHPDDAAQFLSSAEKMFNMNFKKAQAKQSKSQFEKTYKLKKNTADTARVQRNIQLANDRVAKAGTLEEKKAARKQKKIYEEKLIKLSEKRIDIQERGVEVLERKTPPNKAPASFSKDMDLQLDQLLSQGTWSTTELQSALKRKFPSYYGRDKKSRASMGAEIVAYMQANGIQKGSKTVEEVLRMMIGTQTAPDAPTKGTLYKRKKP
jgi:hypothetical protein